jgi:DNA repair exonuclease SbcCD ATPase subunit
MADDTQHGPADGLPPWMRLWCNMAAEAMEASQAWAGATSSPEAVRQARSNLFNAWSDAWEKQFRSTFFATAAKQALSGGAEVRKQVQEFLDQINRELRLAGRVDVDQLTSAVRRVEQRLSDQLEEVSARLDALAERLDDLAERLGASEDSESPGEESSSNNHGKRKSRQTQSRQPS